MKLYLIRSYEVCADAESTWIEVPQSYRADKMLSHYLENLKNIIFT